MIFFSFKKRVMFKKCQHLTFETTNTSFEELYNIFCYNSDSTRMINLVVTPVTKGNRVFFKGNRIIKVPFSEKLDLYFPSSPKQIVIDINGYIDSKGNVEMTYEIPEDYKDYVIGHENIIMKSKGESTEISVKLKYAIMEANKTDSMMDSIRNKAYNSVMSTVESHIMMLYTSKRGIVFGRSCSKEIKTIEDFQALIDKQ